MQCPVCNVPLSISSREGVEIDFCPDCRGVWLDRGELDKVIERAARDISAVGPAMDDRRVRAERDDDRRPYRDDDRYRDDRYGDDRHRKKRRRGSFLEDMFDFD